jgi:PAS domain S-box-containing protein
MIFLAAAISAIIVLLPAQFVAIRTAVKNRDQREWLFMAIGLSFQLIWCSTVAIEVTASDTILVYDEILAFVGFAISLASLMWVLRLRAGQAAARRAKDELIHSEAAWRLLFEKGSDAVFIFDSSTRLIEVNERACALLGYTRSELLDLDPMKVVHASTRENVPSEIAAARQGIAGFYKHKMIRKDGRIITVELSASPLPDGRLMATVRDQTERIKTEESLRHSVSMMSQAAKVARIGYFTLDLQTNNIVASEEIYRITELDPATPLQTSTLLERTHPDDVASVQRELNSAIVEHRAIEIEYRAKLPSGALRYLRALGKIDCDSNGNAIRALVAVQDITEHKYTEQILLESEERFRRLYTETPAIMHSIDAAARITSVSRAWLDKFGYEEHEVLGQHSYDFLTPKSRAFVMNEAMPSLFSDGRRERVPLQFVKKSGEIVDVLLTAFVERNSSGSVARAMAFLQDVTDQLRAEAALATSEAKYRALVETTNTGFAILDDRGHVVDANPEYVRLTGHRSLHEILDRKPVEWTAPDQQQKNSNAIARCLCNGYERDFETVHRWADGTEVPIEINATVVCSEGRPKILALCRDITERRRSVEALRNSERLHRSLVNLSPDGIFIFADGQIVFANEAMVRLLHGSHENELLGLPVDSIIHPDYREMHAIRISEVGRRIGAINPIAESKAIRLDGTTVEIEVTSVLINWKDRPAVQVIVRDISARKRAEQEQARLEDHLRLSQKLETIGTLAAGIAHDFNNLLVPIIGYSELTASECQADSPAQDHLSEVLRAAYRAKSLVSHILSFSRQQIGERRTLMLGHVTQETIALLRSTFPSDIQVVQTINDFKPVMADATQMHQVIMNLCVNASQAMPSGGILSVVLETVTTPQSSCPSCGKMIKGEHVHLTIQDTGCGMDRETRTRIFDPFFSTKPIGQGSGLGLAVAHGIVTQHNGHICAESEPGTGSTFHLFIPAVEPAAVQESPANDHIPRGTESILIVDDEPDVIKTLTTTMESIGYVVTAVGDPRAAVELFRSSPDKFDLVLTDYRMPGMKGDELAVELLRIRPEIPILLVSGHTDALSIHNSRGFGIYDILIKPVPVRDLQKAMRSALTHNNVLTTQPPV